MAIILYFQACFTLGLAAYLDHLPIILSTTTEKRMRPGKIIFTFEAMWVEAKECSTIIKESWRDNTEHADMDLVMERISQCSKNLEMWNKEVFSSVRKQIQQAWNNLDKLQHTDPRVLGTKDHTQLRAELQHWLEIDEIIWRQISKALRLKEGHCNTN